MLFKTIIWEIKYLNIIIHNVQLVLELVLKQHQWLFTIDKY